MRKRNDADDNSHSDDGDYGDGVGRVNNCDCSNEFDDGEIYCGVYAHYQGS